MVSLNSLIQYDSKLLAEWLVVGAWRMWFQVIRSIVYLMFHKKRTATTAHRLRGITALSIFFLAGAAISLTASLSLLRPQSFLESMWRLNPHAHENLSSLGLWAVVLLATVSLFCAGAAIGLWRGSSWGHWLAVGLITVNLLGDIINVVIGTEPRAIVGVPIAAAILAYLMSKRVRDFFGGR